jgi:hypothetical protein
MKAPTENRMSGAPLMKKRGYVFVMSPETRVKHLYLGETPNEGDATACGVKIGHRWPWAQRALGVDGRTYCRECERIKREAI